jgi:hypothetical protein
VDADAGEVILVIHWKGGVHTELRLPRRRRGQNSSQTSKDIIEAVRVLARICSDDLLASALNRNGRVTGRGNRWTRERVVSLRTHHDIVCYDRDRRVSEGWMNLNEAARVLGISARTLRLPSSAVKSKPLILCLMARGCFSVRRSTLQRRPRSSLACGTEITDPQYHILSNEISFSGT